MSYLQNFHLLDLVLETAAKKVRVGDIRGARVRVEKALNTLREIEAKHCNDCGILQEDSLTAALKEEKPT